VRFSGAEAVAFVDQAATWASKPAPTNWSQQNEAGQVGVEAARSALAAGRRRAQRAETAPARRRGQITRDGDETTATRSSMRSSPARCAATCRKRRARIWAIACSKSPRSAPASTCERERDAITILRAANTTSDFPKLLEAAANKMLLARYTTAQPTYQAIAARDLTDFKTTKLLRVGDFPTLLAYQEDGAIQAGTINEGRETVILGSYRPHPAAVAPGDRQRRPGRVRQTSSGRSAWSSAGSKTRPSGDEGGEQRQRPEAGGQRQLLQRHARQPGRHGTAVDVTTLGAGRAAMRKQKDLDGNALNIAPAIILNGPDTETAIEQFLAPIVAAEARKVNPFSSKLQQVTEASITGNAWELYADPAELPAFNYGYLADAPGPRVMTEEPFNVDGMAFRVTLDFYFGRDRLPRRLPQPRRLSRVTNCRPGLTSWAASPPHIRRTGAGAPERNKP
jgi:hypothetical protein